MPNQVVAELVAHDIGDLPHPDPQISVVRIAGLSTLGKPPQFAAQLREQSARIGEGVVHLIETNGWVIIRQGELTELREAAAIGLARPTPIATVRCNGACTDPLDRQAGVRLLELNISHPEQVRADGGVLIRALAARDPNCATNHRALT